MFVTFSAKVPLSQNIPKKNKESTPKGSGIEFTPKRG